MLHPMRYPCALSTDEIRRAQVCRYRVSLLRTLSPHPPPKRNRTVFDDLEWWPLRTRPVPPSSEGNKASLSASALESLEGAAAPRLAYGPPYVFTLILGRG